MNKNVENLNEIQRHELGISDVIVSLSKQLNGDDVKVEDCIYKGKKKYYKEIKIN
jgi:hypothetical protein